MVKVKHPSTTSGASGVFALFCVGHQLHVEPGHLRSACVVILLHDLGSYQGVGVGTCLAVEELILRHAVLEGLVRPLPKECSMGGGDGVPNVRKEGIDPTALLASTASKLRKFEALHLSLLDQLGLD